MSGVLRSSGKSLSARDGQNRGWSITGFGKRGMEAFCREGCYKVKRPKGGDRGF